MDNEGEICNLCGYKIKYITQPFCMKCGKPLEYEDVELCGDCKKGRHEYERNVAVFGYTQALKESIYRFKYGNKREYACFYGKSIAQLKGHIIRSWQPDCIIPIPLHKSRYRRRGFNQAELIARELGKSTGIEVVNNLLIRTKNTKAQKTLNDKERAQNVKKAFQVRHNVVKYKKVLLIDDIYTTGTTIDACAKILKEAGVEKVYSVTLCIGRGY